MTGEPQDLIVPPGVTVRLFWCRNDGSGEEQICALVNEGDYFTLERQAQKRGKSVAENLYPQMIDALQSHGYNTPPDCFFVTLDVPPGI